MSSCCIHNVIPPSDPMKWLVSIHSHVETQILAQGHMASKRGNQSWKLSGSRGHTQGSRTQGGKVCPALESRDDTSLAFRESLSTPVIPAAIPCPATHPAATAMTAGSTPWTLWSQSKTPSPRAAPVTAALILPSTPPAPAACHWPRHLGLPSLTSHQEVLAFVGVGARPLGIPTMQTGEGRSRLPLWLLPRARPTDRSCTTQAPAPLQA